MFTSRTRAGFTACTSLVALGLAASPQTAHAQTQLPNTAYAIAFNAVNGSAGQQSFTAASSTAGVTITSASYGSDGIGTTYDTTHNPNAPQAIFNQQMYDGSGTLGFTFSGLVPGTACTETIDLAEDYYYAAGKGGNFPNDGRMFGLTINGVSALPTSFSIADAASAQYNNSNGFHQAIAETFTQAADSNGKLALVFTASGQRPLVGGVEVFGKLAAAPEPSQTAALGLGVLGIAGLALKARRRRSVA